jgi:hypothetical protein
MTKSKETKPQYRYIKVNETRDWDEEFVKKLGINGVIWAVYAYDSSVVTHCCELTPSYEMIYLGTEFTTDSPYDSIDCEFVEEELRDVEAARDTNYSYMHCNDVERIISYPLIGDYEKDEDVMEQYGANPGCFDCIDRTLTVEQLKKDVSFGKYNYTNPSSINFIHALRDVFQRKYKRIKFEKIQYAQQLAWDECNGDGFNKVIVLMEKLCRLIIGKDPWGKD